MLDVANQVNGLLAPVCHAIDRRWVIIKLDISPLASSQQSCTLRLPTIKRRPAAMHHFVYYLKVRLQSPKKDVIVVRGQFASQKSLNTICEWHKVGFGRSGWDAPGEAVVQHTCL